MKQNGAPPFMPKNTETDRKIAFVNIDNEKGIKKVMICKRNNGFLLFEFNTKLDCNSIADLFFEKLEYAELHCLENYNIKKEDWFSISNQKDFCNADYIIPVKLNGRENGKYEFDNWEVFQNNKWHEFTPPYDENINGMTGNERLYFNGLFDEYYEALKQNKEKARKILVGLEFDDISIKRILSTSASSKNSETAEIQPAILKLQDLGQMPTEQFNNNESIDLIINNYDSLLDSVKKPINYAEGLILIKIFPEGFFYNLHWELLRLIESIIKEISEEKYLELINQCSSKEWRENLITRFNNYKKNNPAPSDNS